MLEPSFSDQYARSHDVHQAIRSAVTTAADGAGLIDPAEVVRRLIAEHPDIDVAPAELAEEVVRAAADAGVRIAYRPAVEP